MASEGFDYTVRVEGLDQVNDMLRNLASKLPEKADRIIEDGAEQIFSLSQSLCPVDTGTLLASGSHNHTFLMSQVGYNTEYAGYVEFGTSRMAAQPYLTPAVEAFIPDIIERMQTELAET